MSPESPKRAWEQSYPEGARWDVPIDVTTLPALLDEAVAAHGDRPAIEFRERRISFRELGARADHAAAALIAAGLRPGERVALYLPNTPWHPVFFFGALRAGGVVVHLSPLDPPRALAAKLADAGARFVLTTNIGEMVARAAALGAERVIVGEDDEWGAGATPMPSAPDVTPFRALPAPPVAAWPEVAPADLALLQYTGGTTGAPRAAMLTHANLTAAVAIYEAWARAIGRAPAPDDRVIGVLPLFHIYALTAVLLRNLRAGAEILLRARFDVESVLRDIEEKRATAFPGVPTMWIALANHPGIETRDFSSLRTAGSGGAPLPAEVRERFERLCGLRIGGGWGMTETSPAGTNIPPGAPQQPGAIGLPLPGIDMSIGALDDPAHALPPGEVGEIRIRGPNVTQGYWNRPDETARAFVDGWFLTGDIGKMDERGFFFLIDRKKDMLISGGFNVYPRNVEEAIYEHPSVAEAIVIGVPDAYRGQAAKAFVTLRAGAAPFTLDALRDFLSERLGRHELPASLEFRDSLPRTPVGKLSKKELVEEEMARNPMMRSA